MRHLGDQCRPVMPLVTWVSLVPLGLCKGCVVCKGCVELPPSRWWLCGAHRPSVIAIPHSEAAGQLSGQGPSSHRRALAARHTNPPPRRQPIFPPPPTAPALRAHRGITPRYVQGVQIRGWDAGQGVDSWSGVGSWLGGWKQVRGWDAGQWVGSRVRTCARSSAKWQLVLPSRS